MLILNSETDFKKRQIQLSFREDQERHANDDGAFMSPKCHRKGKKTKED